MRNKNSRATRIEGLFFFIAARIHQLGIGVFALKICSQRVWMVHFHDIIPPETPFFHPANKIICLSFARLTKIFYF